MIEERTTLIVRTAHDPASVCARWRLAALRTVVLAALLFGLTAVGFGQAKAPAPSVRSITVASEPNAKVWINGVLYGTTSVSGTLTIATVSAGRKTIRVRADGFKETTKPLLPTQAGNFAVPLTKTSDEAELAFQEAERLASVDRAKAVAAYERAAGLRPNFVEAYIGQARTLLEMGEIEKVEAAIAKVRKAKPGLAEASVIEGRLQKSIGENEKAVAAFRRAIKESGGFQPEAYAGLGLFYKERAEESSSSGEFEQETAHYAEAAKNLNLAIKQLSGSPDSTVMYQMLGLVYEQQKKPAAAIAVYQEFLKFFPGHPETEAFQSFITQLRKQSEQ